MLSLSTGCIGPAALPKPTVESVTIADILGMWKYKANYGKTTILLDLKANGKFGQFIRYRDRRTVIHESDWKLEETKLTLNVLDPVFGKPGEDWTDKEVE